MNDAENQDRGKQIVCALRSVRDFHASVGKLLQAATTAMAEYGWKVPSRAPACASTPSRAVYNSRYWMPEDGFQFYRNDADFTCLAFVAVIFDDAKAPERVTEPMVTAGKLTFVEESSGAAGGYEYRWCRISLIADNESQMNGKWRDVDVPCVYRSADYQVLSARTLACPLLSIRNEDDLIQRIVEPLWKELSQIGNTPTEP